MFKPAAGPRQGDPSDVVETVAVLMGLPNDCEELAESLKHAILLGKGKRTRDPRPGMLVNGFARGENGCQMLPVHREELFRL
jgi:hypothetical protein